MVTLSALLSAAVLVGSTHPSDGPDSSSLRAAVRRYVAEYAAGDVKSAHDWIPAWARKYNVNCSACHAPAMPRLNEAGIRFKWAGYRMPEEIGEAVEVGKVQNYLAAGASAEYEYDKTEGRPTNTSAFSVPGVTVFYAGPFGRNYSGFFELEHGPNNEIGRIAQLSALWGKERSYGGIRLGQMHYLAEWGLAGFDRPIGISAPLPIEGPISGAIPFTLGEHQVGAEAFYVYGGNRFSAQVLNGINAQGAGGLGDADTRKDFLVTDQILIDSAGSGVQGVAYYGTITGLDTTAAGLNSHFWRLGLTANKVIRDFEILGAVIYGKDTDLPATLGISSNKGVGTWVTGQYTFSRAAETPLTLFGRFEYVDPNTDAPGDADRRFVLGAVLPLNVPQYLRWALEFRRDAPQGGLPKTNNVTTELRLNF